MPIKPLILDLVLTDAFHRILGSKRSTKRGSSARPRCTVDWASVYTRMMSFADSVLQDRFVQEAIRAIAPSATRAGHSEFAVLQCS